MIGEPRAIRAAVRAEIRALRLPGLGLAIPNGEREALHRNAKKPPPPKPRRSIHFRPLMLT